MAALHPTPAVGGTPTGAALDVIRMLEAGRARPLRGTVRLGRRPGRRRIRGRLTGRARSTPTVALLHAGAGIVAGSEPEAEWVETQAKLTPMLQALVRP